jgi:hypothetical protein
MVNAKAMLQLIGQAMEEGITGVTCGHDQMSGQGDLGGAHRPDVQIMHFIDLGI